jgi:CxxC-x17-CxxC domain-containing protein
MEYKDKVLKCVDCGTEFVFTAGEQLFYADKGFKNEPKRCKACKNRKSSASGNVVHESHSSARVVTTTTCSQCGKETTVPFKVTQGRPVYCRECFQQRRAAGMN